MNIEIPYLSYDSFIGYGLGVEELSVTYAKLRTINTQAFINVRGLKKLDLSNNAINGVHDNAFAEVRCKLIIRRLENKSF